jgi:hypothetical protein
VVYPVFLSEDFVAYVSMGLEVWSSGPQANASLAKV